MKDDIAETLIGGELGMETPEAKDAIAQLRYLAAVKYDGYQQFEPGSRFMESLALWLRNFKSNEEKLAAYNFIIYRMIYIGDIQISHLVRILYPQQILPILIDQARLIDNIPRYQIKRIRTSRTFDVLRRKSLFLALSDGARIDMFRRNNALNNDQVNVSIDLSPEKLDRMHDKLVDWLKLTKEDPEATFQNIFLIDDFSGSGNSILRKDKGEFKGVIARFINERFENDNTLSKICVKSGVKLFIVTYVATRQAYENLGSVLVEYCKFIEESGLKYFASFNLLEPLQMLENNLKIPQSGNKIDEDFDTLLQAYYDDRLEDEHTKTGGTNVIHGYAGCALPLVLCHNCPNNSVYLLWGQTERSSDRQGLIGLFPRVARYLEGR